MWLQAKISGVTTAGLGLICAPHFSLEVVSEDWCKSGDFFTAKERESLCHWTPPCARRPYRFELGACHVCRPHNFFLPGDASASLCTRAWAAAQAERRPYMWRTTQRTRHYAACGALKFACTFTGNFNFENCNFIIATSQLSFCVIETDIIVNIVSWIFIHHAYISQHSHALDRWRPVDIKEVLP